MSSESKKTEVTAETETGTEAEVKVRVETEEPKKQDEKESSKQQSSQSGVKTVSNQGVNPPACPQCGKPSLKLRRNRKKGERVYCAECGYDTADISDREVTSGSPGVTTIGRHGVENPHHANSGLKIMTNRGQTKV